MPCDNFNYAINIILAILLVGISSSFSIHVALRMVRYLNLGLEVKRAVITTNLMKIFINHFQVLSSLFVFPLDWPTSCNVGIS